MEKHFCRGIYNRWNSLITVSHNSASLGKYKGQFTTVQLQSTTSFQLWPREYLSLLWTKAWIQGKEIFYYIENISWGRMRMHFIDVQIETLTKGHSLSVIRKLFSNVLYSIAYSDIWVLYVMISTHRYHVNPFVNVLRYSRKKIIRRRYRYGWKNKVLKVWEYNQKWYSSHLLRVVITVGVCNDRTICCHTSERHLLQPHIWKLWQSQTHTWRGWHTDITVPTTNYSEWIHLVYLSRTYRKPLLLSVSISLSVYIFFFPNEKDERKMPAQSFHSQFHLAKCCASSVSL